MRKDIGQNDNSKQRIDKYLIANQSGFTWAFIGICISLFIGLSIRSYFAPERIKQLIQKASVGIHKDLKFNIEHASLSLSEGPWPRLGVLVKNIKIESTTKCYLSPMAEVDELRLPISVSDLFRGALAVRQVQLNYMNLFLRAKPSDCPEQADLIEKEIIREAEQEVVKQEPSPQDLQNSEDPLDKFHKKNNLTIPEDTLKPSIESLRINKLRVSYLPSAYMSMEIVNFVIKLKVVQPQSFTVQGKVNLGEESLVGEYTSHANFNFEYDEANNKQWSGKVIGNWREGHYDIFADYSPEENSYNIFGDLKHIPLSQIIHVLRRNEVVDMDLNANQVWLNLNIKSKGSTKGDNPIFLSGVSLEGDLGEIKTDKIVIKKTRPLEYEPFRFDIKGLNVEKLLTFLNRVHPSRIFGSLGVLDGSFEFYSPENAIIRGEHKGLQINFTKNGQSEIQTINLISGELKLLGEKWSLFLDKLRIEDGVFSGDLNLQADRKWKELSLKLKMNELGFSPKVQKLMTSGGQVGAISGDLDLDLNKGEVKLLQGGLKFENLKTDGIDFQKLSLELHTQADGLALNLESPSIYVDKKSPANTLLTSFIDKKWYQEDGVGFKNTSVQLFSKRLKDFKWSKLNSTLDKRQAFINSEGYWDELQPVVGTISVRTPTRTKKYRVYGDAENPNIEELLKSEISK